MMLLNGNSNSIWHFWCGRFPNSVGYLIGPSYGRKVPIQKTPWMPFVLDNDAYAAWRDKKVWDVHAWRKMLIWVKDTGMSPLWAAVPDVVADRQATIANWDFYADEILALGWNAAFVVQDGMTPDDVPKNASVIFVGGTDGWKLPSVPVWTENFPRVHCGRVNPVRVIEYCERMGCESVDGTGWFMDPTRSDKLPALEKFIKGERCHPDWMP